MRYFERFIIYALRLVKRVPLLNRTAFNIIINKQTSFLFKQIKTLTVHFFLGLTAKETSHPKFMCLFVVAEMLYYR